MEGKSSMPLRQFLALRWQELEDIRQPWLRVCEDIVRFVNPHRGIFADTDYDQWHERDDDMLKMTPKRAVRTLAAGLQAGLTSPARPWFRLMVADPYLSEFPKARLWLDDVRDRMMTVFHKSNFYNALHSVYAELGSFGTGPLLIDPDFDKVIRCRSFTFGEYVLNTNGKLEVDTFGRHIRMGALSLVKTFGEDALPLAVRRAANDKPFSKFSVYHFIEPNDGRYPMHPLERGKPFVSVYWMPDAPKDAIVSAKGYREFPLMAPRWDSLGPHVYGMGPGWEALPDAKQLMVLEMDKLAGIELSYKPPLQAPVDLRESGIRNMPGGVTYVNPSASNMGIRPLYDVKPDLAGLQQTIMDVEESIRQTFYADLFLMLSMSDRREMTAREVSERHEEKLLMLGPVLERLDVELLNKAISRTYDIMTEAELLPPPPEELQGRELRVEYVSLLAQSQKLVGTLTLEQFVTFVGGLAQVKPEALDKVDADQLVDEYADMLGVPASVVVSDEMVARIRQSRAQQAAAAQMMATAEQGAKAAKDLSSAETGGTNLLDQIIQSMQGGYGVPGGG